MRILLDGRWATIGKAVPLVTERTASRSTTLGRADALAQRGAADALPHQRAFLNRIEAVRDRDQLSYREARRKAMKEAPDEYAAFLGNTHVQ